LIDSEDDVTICFITTQLKWQSEYDISIDPSFANGLKKTSLVRLNKIATIDKNLIIGLLGCLDEENFSKLDKNLIRIFQLQDWGA